MAEEKRLKIKIIIRHDTSSKWATTNPILLSGEMGVETDTNKFKFGNGQDTWNVLPYASANAAELEVKSSQVIMDQAFKITSPIGVITEEQIKANNGFVEFAKIEDENFNEWFQRLTQQATRPKVTQPTVTLTSNNIGAKEVGTKVGINFSYTTNPGSYEFGPATGVSFSNFSTVFNGETKTGSSGTFSSVTVGDSTNLNITGSCSSSEGAIPLNNLQNQSIADKIQAKTFSNLVKGTLSGYRGWFYGYKTSSTLLTIDSLDSAAIRGLLATPVRSFPNTINTTGMQQMFFAAPKGKVNKLTIANAVNGAPQTVQKTTVRVEGANQYAAIDYDIYYVSNAAADSSSSATTYKITIG